MLYILNVYENIYLEGKILYNFNKIMYYKDKNYQEIVKEILSLS